MLDLLQLRKLQLRGSPGLDARVVARELDRCAADMPDDRKRLLEELVRKRSERW